MTDSDNCIAANVRRLRIERGWSVRDLATLAKLSTRTIVNVEQGLASKFHTQLKIAEAMQVPLECLCKPLPPENRPWQVLRQIDARWYFAVAREAERHCKRFADPGLRRETAGFDRCPDSIQSESERFRLGRNGQSSGFFQERSGQLRSGGYKVRLVEVYDQVEFASDPSEFTFQVHVVRGNVVVDVPDESIAIERGDTFLYVADEPLALKPAVPIASSEHVPLVLLTRLAVLSSGRNRGRRREAMWANPFAPHP